MGSLLARLSTTILVLVAVVLGGAVVQTPPAAAVPLVDASSAEKVRAAYREYRKAALVPTGSTGSADRCVAGTSTETHRASILRRVNLVRGLVGLEPVAFEARANLQAQAAALIMAGNETLTHHPDTAMKCWTVPGYEGATRSNLCLECGDSIAAYMDDWGDDNTTVGHRRWILNRDTRIMGSGSVGEADALWVVDDPRPSRAGPTFASWPSRGFFPSQFLPRSDRWHIQTPDPGTQLTNATVAVRGPRGAVPARVISRTPDHLVWELPDLPAVTGQAVARYSVTISGIRSGGGAASHSYDVDVIDGAWVDVYSTPGTHFVGGRDWRTTCAPYSATERCRTEIWGTVITKVDGRHVQTNGWQFNSLTYKPSARTLWRGNPLATPGEHLLDGRRWRTRCDDAWTGRNACRSEIWVTVVAVENGRYVTKWMWVFNNIVRFR